jgi:hypothetical protein
MPKKSSQQLLSEACAIAARNIQICEGTSEDSVKTIADIIYKHMRYFIHGDEPADPTTVDWFEFYSRQG